MKIWATGVDLQVPLREWNMAASSLDRHCPLSAPPICPHETKIQKFVRRPKSSSKMVKICQSLAAEVKE
eukprot:7210326-Ditylum_brightwellii.AAC.1